MSDVVSSKLSLYLERTIHWKYVNICISIVCRTIVIARWNPFNWDNIQPHEYLSTHFIRFKYHIFIRYRQRPIGTRISNSQEFKLFILIERKEKHLQCSQNQVVSMRTNTCLQPKQLQLILRSTKAVDSFQFSTDFVARRVFYFIRQSNAFL